MMTKTPSDHSPADYSAADEDVVEQQLHRRPRGVVRVGWRCHEGRPGVIVTEPRLSDGSPFPTTYYLTCPSVIAGVSTLEGAGVMAEMNQQLAQDSELATAYRRAHEAYLADRAALGEVPEIDNFSAGGMPERVKCLHALVAHSLAAGPGVNPFGDQALAMLADALAKPCLADQIPTDQESAR